MIELNARLLHGSLVFVLLAALSPLLAQTTMRLSVDAAGNQANASSFAGSASADGRWVAFHSLASNLVAGDGNGQRDIFVHDRATGAVERVSVDLGGGDPDGESRWPRISSDGRFIAFQSEATDLVLNDTNGLIDVFVCDRILHVTQRVSVGPGGVQANGPSPAVHIAVPLCVDISGDGRFVAFDSAASNLVAGDTNGRDDVFVRDLIAGVTERVSIDASGAQLSEDSITARISDDGSRIAFRYYGSLDPLDLDGEDTCVRDRSAGTTLDISVLLPGVAQVGLAVPLDISGDGNVVLFGTFDDPTSVNSSEVYVHDLALNSTTRVSVPVGGGLANAVSGVRTSGALSLDGRWAVFDSDASDLVAGDSNGGNDVFVRDLANGVTELVSTSSTGAQAHGLTRAWACSADGTSVFFDAEPLVNNLVAADTNSTYDAFVRDRASNCAPVTSYCTAKINSLGCTPLIGASGEPRLSGNDAFFITATRVLSQKSRLFFWGTHSGATPFGGGTRCVLSPLTRTAIQSSGGSPSGADCSGTYSFYFSQAYMAAHAVGAGVPLCGQYWSRDPGFAPPNNVGLTDGLAFTPCP